MCLSQIPTLQHRGLLPLLAVIIVWSCIVPQARAEYKYPVGIPKAWIEPDVARPARPNPWDKEVPGYYFVNQTKGNDKGRTNGTPTAPRKSIPRAAMNPGSYTEISGVYNYSNSSGGFVLGASGNGDNWVANTSGPVWIVGSYEGKRASLVKGFILTGTYLCIENIDNKAGNQPWQFSTTNSSLAYKANHMLVRNCEIDGGGLTGGTGVAVASNSSEAAHDIVFYKNSIHGYGPDVPGNVDSDYNGFFVLNGSHDIWAMDNVVHDMAGCGLSVATALDGPENTYNIYFGRNHVYDTWAAGLATKAATNVVFSENLVHDIDYTKWSQAKGIGAQYAIGDVWFICNRIYNCDYGIKIGSTSGNQASVYVVANVISGIKEFPGMSYGSGSYGSAALGIWGGSKRVIVSNTIYGCQRGVAIPKANGPPAVIKNNIFSENQQEDIYIELSYQNSTIVNNLFFRSKSQPLVKLGAISLDPLTEIFENLQGNFVFDPEFRSPETGDFRLQANSRAINKALDPASLGTNPYIEYLEAVKVPFNQDVDGISRPQGAGWDLGAYELVPDSPGDPDGSKDQKPGKPTGPRLPPGTYRE